MSVMDDGSLNLNVVNEAFGARSDLYMDVLQVQPNAGASQIQEAYFDRRNELFQLLADIDHTGNDSVMESHRQQAERKMDAVVCAVRILGDPDLRLQYDDARTERTRQSPSRRLRPHSEHSSRRLHPASSSHSDSVWENVDSSPPGLLDISGNSMNNSTLYTDFSTSSRSKGTADGTLFTSPTIDTEEPSARFSSRNQTAKASSSRKKLAPPPSYPSTKPPRNASVDRNRGGGSALHPPSLLRKVTSSSLDGDASTQLSKESTNYYDDDDDDYEEDETFYTVDDGESTTGGGKRRTSASASEEGFLDRLRAEVLGAIDDTAVAFEQVLNAFTLQEGDIKAVMGRIDKAKRQMAQTHVFYPSTNPKEDEALDLKKNSKVKRQNQAMETASATHSKSLKGRKSPLSTSSKSSTPQVSSRRRELH